MEKFIAPRGSGRTYQICKYAIENDCDIIVPTSLNVELVTKNNNIFMRIILRKMDI